MSILARFRRKKTLSRKILAHAADIIEESGWVRFSYHIPDRGYCALGAIERAATDLNAPRLAEDQAVTRLASTIEMEYSLRPAFFFMGDTALITGWNDKVAGTIDEVVSAFRKAASLPLVE